MDISVGAIVLVLCCIHQPAMKTAANAVRIIIKLNRRKRRTADKTAMGLITCRLCINQPMGVSPGFLRRESLIQISLTYFDERWLANSDRGWKATMNQPDPILRITSNPAILAGKPVIRGTRICFYASKMNVRSQRSLHSKNCSKTMRTEFRTDLLS